MLLVSDNQSFGRVFEFVTPPEIQPDSVLWDILEPELCIA